jgi:hypothetical protein
MKQMTSNHNRSCSEVIRAGVEGRSQLPFQPVTERLGKVTGELEALKQQLLEEQLRSNPDPRLRPWLYRAAEEAATLAWMTSVPLLALPELMNEKVSEARCHARRQQDIKARSQAIVSLAV